MSIWLPVKLILCEPFLSDIVSRGTITRSVKIRNRLVSIQNIQQIIPAKHLFPGKLLHLLDVPEKDLCLLRLLLSPHGPDEDK